MTTLPSCAFVRVRADHPNSLRAGLDGMVFLDSFDPVAQTVALTFGCDRYNHFQTNRHGNCPERVGPELWYLSELDLNTIEP